MQRAVDTVGPTRILFWFPDATSTDYLEFRKKIGAYLPTAVLPHYERVRFVVFDAQWKPSVIRSTAFASLLGSSFAFWYLLAPFLNQAGVPTQLRKKQIAKVLVFRSLLFAFMLWTIISIIGAWIVGNVS